ncbi:MAG: hypothetical protein IVW57_15005 [Ktedonobacterales bacterium]|nr:hypothetical protein [Ktedonobacterales bacterium]
MGKRTIMSLGLALVLVLGIAALAITVNGASAHPAISHASSQTSIQAAPRSNHAVSSQATATATETTEQSGDSVNDPDANAPCAKDAQGNETGNCENSQNSSGPEDNGAGGSGQ